MIPATGGGHLHGGSELASANGEAAHGEAAHGEATHGHSANGEAAHGHSDSDVIVDEDGNVVVSAGHDDSHGDDSSTQTAAGSTGHDDHKRASGSSASSSGGSSASDDHGAHAATSSAANLAATTTTTGHNHSSSATTTTPGQTTSTTVHDHGTTTTTGSPGTTTTTTTAPPVVAAWRMGATDAQVAYTRAFVAATQAAVATFTSFEDAEAKGYVKINGEHMLKLSYMLDDKITDPTAIEALVIEQRGGVDVIVGGMYMLNIGMDEADVPTFGGPLIAWHSHDGFCIAENGVIVGLDPVTGECPPTAIFVDDPPMLHIWSQPVSDAGTVRTDEKCGTFVYLDFPHSGTVPGCSDGGHQH
jgi:hypothetical protein